MPPRLGGPPGLVVAPPVDVGNQERLGWAPSQLFLSQPAGRRVVDRDEGREKAKVAGRALRLRLPTDRGLAAQDRDYPFPSRVDLVSGPGSRR